MEEEKAESKEHHEEHLHSHEHHEHKPAHHTNHSYEDKITERKEKIKSWIKDPYNLALIGIILLAFAFRLYYFWITKSQPLWWDEAEYMSTAKHWIFGIPYDINPQRPPLFQLLAAIFLFVGFSEATIKFLIVLIPSIFLVFAIYLVGKEMFSKKIGLFAALGSSFVWSYLFWTERFQPDFFSMCFQMLSFLFFWKMIKNPKIKYAVCTGIFAALGFYFKISALLVPISMFLFILFLEGFWFFKKKHYWIVLASFTGSMIPFMIWQFFIFGNPLAFAPSYIVLDVRSQWNYGWMALTFFQSFPKLLFFILFLIGLALAIFRIAILGDIILKDKKNRENPEVLSLITLIVVALFYVFFIKGAIEDRWVFLIIPFIFYFSAIGFFKISDYFEKINKILVFIFLIAVFGFFIYAQVQHTSQLIDAKKTSYYQIKDAAIWIKDNSDKNEASLSVSYTQTIAYSERPIYTYSRMSEENFTKLLMEKKPKYIMVSIIEPNHPDWIIQNPRYNDGSWAILLPYFNSSIRIGANQQVSADLKKSVEKGKFRFTLVYPNEINGVFVYKIDYL